MTHIDRFLLLALFGLPAAATVHAQPAEQAQLCVRLAEFARDLAPGERRSVRLSFERDAKGALVKRCAPSSHAPKAAALCDWLSRNTSNEFMDGNISRANECLSGARLIGKNILMHAFAARYTVFDPFGSDPKLALDFEYAMKTRNDFDGSYYAIAVSINPD